MDLVTMRVDSGDGCGVDDAVPVKDLVEELVGTSEIWGDEVGACGVGEIRGVSDEFEFWGEGGGIIGWLRCWIIRGWWEGKCLLVFEFEFKIKDVDEA
jgi:hypothetical protein